MGFLLETLFLLFSISDMMLTALLKPLIVHAVRAMASSSVMVSSSAATLDDVTGTLHDVIVTVANSVTDVNGSLVTIDPSAARVNLSAGDAVQVVPGGEEAEDEVEKRVAAYLMADLLCCYVPSFLTGLYCGAWSDKHGRKPPLIFPPLGHVLCVLVYAVLLPYHQDQLLALLIVAALLRGVLGKGAVFTMALCSLLSDTQPQGQLSSRFASLMASRYIGICIGAFAGGVVHDTLGVDFGLWATLVIQVICLVGVVFFVKETVNASKDDINSNECKPKNQNENYLDNILSKFSFCCLVKELKPEKTALVTGSPDLDTSSFSIFDEDQIKAPEKEKPLGEGKDLASAQLNYQTFQGEGKEDKGKSEIKTPEAPEETDDEETKAVHRKLLVAIIVCMAFITQSLGSSQTEVIVMTTSSPPLSWPGSWYGYLCTAYYGAGGVGLLVLVPCRKSVLPQSSVGETVVLVFALLCCGASSLWTGLVSDSPAGSWQIFAAYMLGAQSLMVSSSLRSVSSVIVSSASTGRVMAAISVMESLAKVLGPLLHTTLYVTALPLRMPGLVYFVLSGEVLLLLPLVLVIHRCVARLAS